MSVRRRKYKNSTGKVVEVWMVDVEFTHPDGRVERVRKVSPVRTRRGAEDYEREVRAQLARGGCVQRKEPSKQVEVPTLKAFAKEFLNTYAAAQNKASEVASKQSILERHLVPELGVLQLDQISKRHVDGYKAVKLQVGLSAKTVNNHLTVLSMLLKVARDWELVSVIPAIKLLKVSEPAFRFLEFREAEALTQSMGPDWRAMVFVALRTGLRLGELRALRWADVDLKGARIIVRQAAWGDVIDTPKSGKSREVPLGEAVRHVLKEHKHLRGEYVFCQKDGTMLSKGMCKHPLWRAAEAAGLGRIGWHVLRHTFASHLAMRGASMKQVQELLGHADIKMTMRYAHLSPEVRLEAVALLDLKPSGTLAAHGRLSA